LPALAALNGEGNPREPAASLFPWVGFLVLGVGVPAVIVIVFVYSYVQWSRDPAKVPLGRVRSPSASRF
jgi:hypothetical protein